MRHQLCTWGLGICLLSSVGLSQVTVSAVKAMFPSDLTHDTLLIPIFEEVPEVGLPKRERQKMAKVNKLCREHNKTIQKIVAQKYDFPVKLVPLASFSQHKERGHYYALDYVAMPKFWPTYKQEAMWPSYRIYDHTREMYRITNYQFYYYFYIRDLSTDVAYVPKKPHGTPDVYNGMGWLLKKVSNSF